jgi:diguanylate cyclase (GGDEF)-like protein
VTVSIGVAAFEETTDKGDLLVKFADDALYQAKRAGRDRVVVARSATGAAQLAATATRQS